MARVTNDSLEDCAFHKRDVMKKKNSCNLQVLNE